MKKDWKRYALVLLTMAASIGLDQYTKEYARNHIQGTPVQTYWNDFFRILFVENEGAFLSMGSGLSEDLRYWALTILPVFILALLLVYTLFSSSLNRWQVVAYSFILGGGISNIYDRIQFGKVVDFMNMGIGDLRTGIFNVADVCIMIGLFMLLPYIFVKPKHEKSEVGSDGREPRADKEGRGRKAEG